MAAVTICTDFGTPKNSLSLFPLFPHLFAVKWWDMLLLQYSKIMSYSESISTICTNIVSFAFEKTLESPLDCKEIKPISLKGNQPWIFIGRTDAEAEALILWTPDVNSWLNGHEFEQASGNGKGQGSLACCSPWGCKDSDMTEWLNNNRAS